MTSDPVTARKVELALERLSRSAFRSRFDICAKDRAYAVRRGRDTVAEHTRDFIEKRLAPAFIPNDGKQTPMRGHPTFTAQHATATCCRSCLEKWHGIGKGRVLSAEETDFVCALIGEWIDRHMGIWE